MQKKSGSNIYEGIVVYIQGQIKDVNRKKWYQGDVCPLHLCRKHQNVQFGFDVVTDIIVQNSTKECGLCWDDDLRKSYYNTE